MPVRYYSPGMLVRLAFSIATAIEPEILIIDEVLAAGDMAFQTKARRRMQGLMSSARAVIVVSHDLQSLTLMCDRAMWLEHGRMQMIGPTEQVIAAYTQQVSGGGSPPFPAQCPQGGPPGGAEDTARRYCASACPATRKKPVLQVVGVGDGLEHALHTVRRHEADRGAAGLGPGSSGRKGCA